MMTPSPVSYKPLTAGNLPPNPCIVHSAQYISSLRLQSPQKKLPPLVQLSVLRNLGEDFSRMFFSIFAPKKTEPNIVKTIEGGEIKLNVFCKIFRKNSRMERKCSCIVILIDKIAEVARHIFSDFRNAFEAFRGFLFRDIWFWVRFSG